MVRKRKYFEENDVDTTRARKEGIRRRQIELGKELCDNLKIVEIDEIEFQFNKMKLGNNKNGIWN